MENMVDKTLSHGSRGTAEGRRDTHFSSFYASNFFSDGFQSIKDLNLTALLQFLSFLLIDDAVELCSAPLQSFILEHLCKFDDATTNEKASRSALLLAPAAHQ